MTSNLASVSPVASDEKIFENVDDRWTEDGCLAIL